MNKATTRNIMIGVAGTVIGVIVAGLILKNGYANDWPVIKDAAEGYDQ